MISLLSQNTTYKILWLLNKRLLFVQDVILQKSTSTAPLQAKTALEYNVLEVVWIWMMMIVWVFVLLIFDKDQSTCSFFFVFFKICAPFWVCTIKIPLFVTAHTKWTKILLTIIMHDQGVHFLFVIWSSKKLWITNVLFWGGYFAFLIKSGKLRPSSLKRRAIPSWEEKAIFIVFIVNKN